MDITIDASLDGQRLDLALAQATGTSRAGIQKLLAQGLIKGDLPCRKASEKVSQGMHFCILLPQSPSKAIKPQAFPLEILYEDEHIIVVNKPAGMVVHPGAGHAEGTLVHALAHRCPEILKVGGDARPGIVHRLDKGTSGAMVAAKTQEAYLRLCNMFSRHDLTREYLAWCRGCPSWRSMRIEMAIGRHPYHRKKMAVTPRGRRAITDALVEKPYDGFCRMRLILHTGRTHQIRVHLSHLGLPILGDPTYARAYRPPTGLPLALRNAILDLNRQALHAQVLAFRHPISGEAILCQAPLPVDLQRLDKAFEEAFG